MEFVLGGEGCIKVIGQFLAVGKDPSLANVLRYALQLCSSGGTLGMIIITSVNIIKIIALLGANIYICSPTLSSQTYIPAWLQSIFAWLQQPCFSAFYYCWQLAEAVLFSSLPSQVSTVVCPTGSIRKVQDDLETITGLLSKFCKYFSVQNSVWLGGKLMKSMRTGNRVPYEWKC